MHLYHRRKKHPHYGTKRIVVIRGEHGFGFTISGQQPCILSCIVSKSPADLAGLRAGDFLISVNDINVSKLPHKAVVKLIGSWIDTITLTIAENYFSDSSDEENLIQISPNRVRPKYPHHKLKLNRDNRKSVNKKCLIDKSLPTVLIPNAENTLITTAHKIIHSSSASNRNDIFNVSAMVKMYDETEKQSGNLQLLGCPINNMASHILEYCAVVGYLGTIEMPKQIATSSKLQTVRSCIRKMRQEKRNPVIVLMTIMPNCLTLINTANTLLAKYPVSRLNYISSNSESDNRFFGLVTTTVYADGQLCESPSLYHNSDVIISNSCHVFVIDTSLTEHANHLDKAKLFHISCTKDPISNLCLEFPNSSEYVVDLIRSMYSLNQITNTDATTGAITPKKLSAPLLSSRRTANSVEEPNANDVMMANSPQPSNHSEITTTSSNSDSGIGFHNDCVNISERILVVDFPIQARIGPLNESRAQSNMIKLDNRPLGISTDFDLNPLKNMKYKFDIMKNSRLKSAPAQLSIKSNSLDLVSETETSDMRLAVRAIPDLKIFDRRKESKTLAEQNVSNDLDNSGFEIKQENQSFTDPICSSTGNYVFRPHNFNDAIYSQNVTRSCDNVTTSDQLSLQHKPYDSSKLDIFNENIEPNISTSKTLQKYSSNEHDFVSPKPIKLKRQCVTQSNIMKCSEKVKLLPYSISPKVYKMFKPLSASVEELSQQKCYSENSDYIHLNKCYINQHNLISGTFSEPNIPSRSRKSNTVQSQQWSQSALNETINMRCRSSSFSTENDKYLKASFFPDSSDYVGSKNKRQRVAAWGSSFEKLLEDTAGLHIFSEFLRKEFSAENIYFWTSCERYRHLCDIERRIEAEAIFSKYLALGAPEPVNVDSQARNVAQDNLQYSSKDLFNQAQKQIFNLMKFDSYQRFIKSDLYKTCLEAEINNHSLPFTGDALDLGLTTIANSPVVTKIKKSLSNAEDRRRKSLLPWHRKSRCKSKDRNEDLHDIKPLDNDASLKNSNGSILNTIQSNDIHGSRTSLSSFDAAVFYRSCMQNESEDSKHFLCRVILYDGATTIVQTRPNENIRNLVERLLEKRGIFYRAFEIFLSGSNKPLDLDESSRLLAGKEVIIEQRVVFKLDLPNRKVISVKSKPCKILKDVLRPILNKYNYKFDAVQVFILNSTEALDMNDSVEVTDGLRLQILDKSEDVDLDCLLTQKSGTSGITVNNNLLEAPVNHNHSIKPTNNLDEITNKVFTELLKDKLQFQSKKDRVLSDNESIKSDQLSSEKSSSIFAKLRTKDNVLHNRQLYRKPKNVFGSIDKKKDSTELIKPLISKLKAGSKLHVATMSPNNDLVEGLNRAQRSRIDDQRGIAINFELPDFLKNTEKLNELSHYNEENADSNFEHSTVVVDTNCIPKPAPRLSIINKSKNLYSPSYTISNSNPNPYADAPNARMAVNHPTYLNKNDISNNNDSYLHSSNAAKHDEAHNINEFSVFQNAIHSTSCPRSPPPLPPKPKILPTKPGNWGKTLEKYSLNNHQ